MTTVFAGRVACRDTEPWLWSSALSWRSAISWRITAAENSWSHMMDGRELETHQMTATSPGRSVDSLARTKHPPLDPAGWLSQRSITRPGHCPGAAQQFDLHPTPPRACDLPCQSS